MKSCISYNAQHVSDVIAKSNHYLGRIDSILENTSRTEDNLA